MFNNNLKLTIMKTFPRKSTIEIDCDPWRGMGRQEDYYLAICEMINTEL